VRSALKLENIASLIFGTVTRGLPPAAAGLPDNPPLKPSGLDWLGDIPKHWEFKKLRYLCQITTGDKDTVDAVEGPAKLEIAEGSSGSAPSEASLWS